MISERELRIVESADEEELQWQIERLLDPEPLTRAERQRMGIRAPYEHSYNALEAIERQRSLVKAWKLAHPEQVAMHRENERQKRRLKRLLGDLAA